ncbi:MAG: nucleotidyltransferase family protein [Acetobacteraceae bacterium]|nr:nucleotidyltransferase family protein [Acetobacteraceae bacterium]
MIVRPHSAMILAAGLGTRMRPLTDATPKPLLTLGGKALLDYEIDQLAAVGVQTVVVNAFWQADRLADHLASRQPPPRLILQREDVLLETGGGVKAALPVLGPDPFYVVNGDAFWLDGPHPVLDRMAQALDDEVDGVLLVHRTFQVHAEVGYGDFAVDKWGMLRRRAEREIVPYLYAGLQLIRPSLLDDTPEGSFSMNLAWNRAMENGRLRAVVHDGIWFHLSTPADLAEAEGILQARVTGDTRWPWR